MDKELNNLAAVTIDNNILMIIDLTKDKKLNNLATIIVDNNSQASKIEQH
ncbi:2727_t:CDS:1, partial [Racocetra fulgida]